MVYDSRNLTHTHRPYKHKSSSHHLPIYRPKETYFDLPKIIVLHFLFVKIWEVGIESRSVWIQVGLTRSTVVDLQRGEQLNFGVRGARHVLRGRHYDRS